MSEVISELLRTCQRQPWSIIGSLMMGPAIVVFAWSFFNALRDHNLNNHALARKAKQHVNKAHDKDAAHI